MLNLRPWPQSRLGRRPGLPLKLPPITAAGKQSWTALAFIVALAAALGAASYAARANPGEASPVLVTPAEMKSGALLLHSEHQGRYVQAPLVGTDFDITVSGATARARVTQHFKNPAPGWVEAVYVFPLPETAAVDTLKMVVGGRVIIGDIKERQEAKIIYEQAKAAGQKAGLLEQERPNLFTNSVANIGPGETVVIQIEYQQTVQQKGAEFSLRAPLVMAPRYSPKPVIHSVELGAGGWAGADPAPDRGRIEPPVLDPRAHPPVNPVTIGVKLQAGFPLGAVKSHHHAIVADKAADDIQTIKLDGGKAVPADRDFELTWTPASGVAPTAGLFRENVNGADYALAFIMPPATPSAKAPPPREIVFVIDNSGSMGGTSMVQAKASLLFALDRLKPADRFNVVRFDHTHDALFPDTVPAGALNIRRAKAFIASLEATGGTEMVPAMQAALADPRSGDAAALRQVVFLTDGAIGNEQQLFDTLTAGRGRSRIFMVGIGSAPNSHLMNRAAELGRGSFTHIGSAEQVEERMRGLFARLENPVATGITAKFTAGRADITPDNLPDLYAGEPLQIAAKLGSSDGSLELRGVTGDQPWAVTLTLTKAATGEGLSKLWARRKISDAEVGATLGQLTREAADKRILTLALEHSLVTRLTSLVAIDKTPSRPADSPLTRADVPLNLPAGWDFDKVFGERPAALGEQRAGPDAPRLDQDAAAQHIRLAAAPQAAPAQPAPVTVNLPKGATNAELLMLLGAQLLIISLALAWLGRRKRLSRAN